MFPLYLLCYHNDMCVKQSSKRGKIWRSKFLFYLRQEERLLMLSSRSL